MEHLLFFLIINIKQPSPSANPVINQGFIVEIELSIFGLYANVDYRPADHPFTANDPILLLDLNQEY